MTMWCPTLEGDHALLAELRGDARFTEADVPAPRWVARIADATASLAEHARPDEEPSA